MTLIYVPTLIPDTFVHFSRKGQQACLRDYSSGRFVPPFEVREFNIKTVLTAIAIREPIPRRRKDDWIYWHNQVLEANAKHNLRAVENGRQHDRGLYRMIAEIGKHFEHTDGGERLKATITELLGALALIKHKRVFNKYDLGVPSHPSVFKKGLHWTSWMLSQSRRPERFVETGSEAHDFHAIAQELNLRISASRNPFRAGREESFEPDGIAIRRDGSLAVVEVKAVNDVQHVVPAIAQAFCGALAVHAKIEMIKTIARTGRGERKEADVNFPSDKPYLSLYIMVDRLEIPDEVEGLVSELKRSFAALKDVAFFKLDQSASCCPKIVFKKSM